MGLLLSIRKEKSTIALQEIFHKQKILVMAVNMIKIRVFLKIP